MHRLGGHAAHPEHGGEQVGAGTKMLDGPQKFHAVALLLQGVIRGGDALHLDLAGLQFKGLLGLRGQHQLSAHDQGRAHVLVGDLVVIIQASPLEHHLQRLEAAAVVELDEAEVFHIPHGADPAADRDLLPVKAGGVGKDAGDFLTHQHGKTSSLCWPGSRFYRSRPVFSIKRSDGWGTRSCRAPRPDEGRRPPRPVSRGRAFQSGSGPFSCAGSARFRCRSGGRTHCPPSR